MMKKIDCLVLVLAAMLPPSVVASTTDSKAVPVPLEYVLNGTALEHAADTVRINVLRELGETVGFQSGMTYEAAAITETLKNYSIQLDRLYSFSTLVSPNNALPPVIVEAADVAAITPGQIRTANKVYNIIKPEEFVSVPPTWRDYLYTGLLSQSSPDYPGEDAKPKSSAEREAWQASVKTGWANGVEQAHQILDANFSRLTRDYTGMLRFSSLLKQGMISRTEIASTTQTVSSESTKDKLMIGEHHQQIIRKAEFQTNPEKWRPIITKSQEAAPYSYGGR